jgi:heptosyltransferase II
VFERAEKPARIVVRAVNWLGDAVMSMPALVRLREALPHSHIALLTADKLADLWTDHPAINEVIPFTKLEGIGQVSRKLRAGKFDAALILPNSFRSAFESWMAGIPLRVGYGRPFLLTHTIPPRTEHIEMHKRTPAEVKRLVTRFPHKHRDLYPLSAHHLYQYLRLVRFFGASETAHAPSIRVAGEEVTAFVKKFRVDRSRKLIGLNPGAEYGPAKRWPVEGFIEVAQQINQNCLIFGGSGDAPAGARIAAAVPSSVNLAGKTSLRELAVGLSICDAVLTNDTGPMHLAAAVGTKLVVPFASTSPELTGPGLPGNPRHRLILGDAPCAPCFLRECPIDFRCLRPITSERVLAALRETIGP